MCPVTYGPGEWLAGAKLSFQAQSGPIACETYYGYPNYATYAQDWYSLPDGTFPTNVWLPAVDWSVSVDADGSILNLTK